MRHQNMLRSPSRLLVGHRVPDPSLAVFFCFFLGGETIIINMMNEMIVQDEIINKIVVE